MCQSKGKIMNEVRFTITGDDSNLVIDRMRLGKGSVLVLDQNPPAHWSRFGQVGAPEPELIVATPAAADASAAAASVENATVSAGSATASVESATASVGSATTTGGSKTDATSPATDATSPATVAAMPGMPGMPPVDDEDALRKEFAELAEMAGREDTTADGRWGVQRLKTEIETLKAEING